MEEDCVIGKGSGSLELGGLTRRTLSIPGEAGRVRVGVLDVCLCVYDLLSFSGDMGHSYKCQNLLNMPREQQQQEENYM